MVFGKGNTGQGPGKFKGNEGKPINQKIAYKYRNKPKEVLNTY